MMIVMIHGGLMIFEHLLELGFMISGSDMVHSFGGVVNTNKHNEGAIPMVARMFFFKQIKPKCSSIL